MIGLRSSKARAGADAVVDVAELGDEQGDLVESAADIAPPPNQRAP